MTRILDRRLATFVLAALLAASAGCSREEQRTAGNDAARAVDALSTAAAAVATSGPMLATRDSLAAAAVHARLAAVSPDAASDVHVRVVRGAATLSGRVRDGGVIARLIDAAHGTPGVTSVRSSIEVDPTVPSLGAKVGDAALAARVRAALLRDAGMNAFGITLVARRGVITLGGRAKTAELARTLLAAARGVRGVSSVVDGIHVR